MLVVSVKMFIIFGWILWKFKANNCDVEHTIKTFLSCWPLAICEKEIRRQFGFDGMERSHLTSTPRRHLNEVTLIAIKLSSTETTKRKNKENYHLLPGQATAYSVPQSIAQRALATRPRARNHVIIIIVGWWWWIKELRRTQVLLRFV